MRSKKKKTSLKHKTALFSVYFVLFLALTAMIDYYAYDMISPWIFILISLLASVWATWMHIKKREHSKVDELAHELEEIL